MYHFQSPENNRCQAKIGFCLDYVHTEIISLKEIGLLKTSWLIGDFRIRTQSLPLALVCESGGHVSILLSGIADISDSLKLANRKSVSHARSAPRQLRDCPHFSQPFSGHFELLVSNSTINLFKAHTPKNIPFSLEKWLCVCCFRAFPCNSTYKYVSTLAYLGIDKTGIDIHSMQISD